MYPRIVLCHAKDALIVKLAGAELHEIWFFFFQAEDGIRDYKVTGVQTCALPICRRLGGDWCCLFCGHVPLILGPNAGVAPEMVVALRTTITALRGRRFLLLLQEHTVDRKSVV